MREKEIEQKFRDAVKERGGIAIKLSIQSFDGMPDRMVLFPKGIIAFVEVKAPGMKPRPLQLVRHKMLRSFGFKVFVLDNVDMIAEVIDEILSA